MSLASTIEKHPILLDGPMETRLSYESNVALDANGTIAHLIYDPDVAKKMMFFYSQYIQIAKKYRLPILLNAPTYRASLKHLSAHGYATPDEVRHINSDCIDFVDNVRHLYSDIDIFIMGPVGPKNDAYAPEQKLNVEEAKQYHAVQIEALAQTQVDLISITTMPSLSEALGCALVAEKTNVPYTIGFVVTEEGKLLDGIALEDAINAIDQAVNEKPLCYLLICTHPSIAAKALSHPRPAYQRIQGIKANGACKSPNELAQSNQAQADPAPEFAKQLVALTKQHHWKIVGGCCGTDDTHLEALAALLHDSM